MKAKMQEKNDNKIKYPCLMKERYGNLVVLFTNNKQGLCIFPDNVYKIGDVRDFFIDCFEYFDGTITLENGEL